MGEVLRFPGVQRRASSSSGPPPVSMAQAQSFMRDAAVLLAEGGEIEQEVAWLLEDLAEFLEERSGKKSDLALRYPL